MEEIEAWLLPDGICITEVSSRSSLANINAPCSSSQRVDCIQNSDLLLIRGGVRPSALGTNTAHYVRDVKVSFKLLRVAQVDTVRCSFYADFLVLAQWHEKVLVGLDPTTIDWGVVWDPKLDIKAPSLPLVPEFS